MQSYVKKAVTVNGVLNLEEKNFEDFEMQELFKRHKNIGQSRAM